MKTDLYTKIVLTVIALTLTISCLKELIPTANAAPFVSPKNFVSIPINVDGSINVKLPQNQVVDVRLRGIDEASNLRWEAIKVEVQ